MDNNGIFRKPANYYEDVPPSQISHIPEVELAFISNNKNKDNHIQVTNYIFNTIHLSYADFKICFFDSLLHNFNISPANFEVKALSLHQNYVDTTKKYQSFNLNNAILYAWAEKNQSTISAIPVQQKILLNKNSLMTRSIGSFRQVQNALSWNEAIQTLIASREIIPVKKDKLSCAIIDFKIFVQYNYDPLEVAVNLQFTYRVHVPGYANKCEPNPCYSTDTSPPRKVFNFGSYRESQPSDDGESQPSDDGESQPCYEHLPGRNTEEEERSLENENEDERHSVDEYHRGDFVKDHEQTEYNVCDDGSSSSQFSQSITVSQILETESLGILSKNW
jgi:hypothetical protein